MGCMDSEFPGKDGEHGKSARAYIFCLSWENISKGKELENTLLWKFRIPDKVQHSQGFVEHPIRSQNFQHILNT